MQQNDIKIGDKIQSESADKHPVTVIEITEEGDYLTDERDFNDYFGDSYFVVEKHKAIKL